MVNSAGDIQDHLVEIDIEIRALKRRVEAFSAGDAIRADAISGIIPAANVPVYWWYNGNLLGAGRKVDLIAGAGVWISGTFVVDRAYYTIGAYSMGGGASGTVNWYDEGELIGAALEVDFEAGNCIWISGSLVAGRPTYEIGVYPGCAGGPGGGMSGVDFAVNGDPMCFGAGLDLQEDIGIWISGSCAGAEATYKIGAYAEAAPTSISGVDWSAKDAWLGFGNAVDFEEGAGVWISGSFVAGEAVYEVGVYPPDIPTSISGVDFAANGEPLCFGAGINLQEETGVWISGSCADGEATFQIGAYPTGGGGTTAIIAVIPIAGVASATVPKLTQIIPFNCTVTKVEAILDANETCGATSLTVDIHKIAAADKATDGQGTTLYTTQANIPTITNTNRYVNATLPDVVAIADGDALAFYVNSAGSGLSICTCILTVTKT
ncbi:MAG: hypothetical protein MUO37_04895 [Methyloceanibacter sp.]|nr:hypothetical protein [Methyloceanibacter sp.]